MNEALFQGIPMLATAFNAGIHIGMNQRRQAERNYEFVVHNYEEIDFQSIAEDLSYKDPMRLVTAGKKQVLVIHRSIGEKLACSTLTPTDIDNSFSRGNHSVLNIKHPSAIQEIKERVAQIRSASWMDTYRPSKNPKNFHIFVEAINVS